MSGPDSWYKKGTFQGVVKPISCSLLKNALFYTDSSEMNENGHFQRRIGIAWSSKIKVAKPVSAQWVFDFITYLMGKF